MRGLRQVGWLAVATLAACGGGQSGNEGGAPEPVGPVDDPGHIPGGRSQPDCPCAEFQDSLVMRGVLVAFRGFTPEPDPDGTRVEVQIQELLGAPACVDGDDLRAGDIVGGIWRGRLPCLSRCADVALGETVLAFYKPGDQDCREQQDCQAMRCGPSPDTDPSGEDESGRPVFDDFDGHERLFDDPDAWQRCDEDCVEDTREVCQPVAQLRRLQGEITLAPWAHPIDLGDELIHPSDAAAIGLGGDICEAALATGAALGSDDDAGTDDMSRDLERPDASEPRTPSGRNCLFEDGDVQPEPASERQRCGG